MFSINCTQVLSGSALASAVKLNNANWCGTDLAVANGGTNLSVYAVGDILYASGTTTLAKLTKGSEDEVLTMGDSCAPTWAAAGGISGTGGTDNAILRANGTGGATLQNSAVTIADTTGDITLPAAGQVFAGTGVACNPGVSFRCDPDTGMFRSGADQVAFATGGTERLRLAGQCIYFNDTANGSSCAGFTINQLGEDNSILTFKSSDMTSGMTSLPGQWDVEVDTYADFGKAHVTDGGLMIHAITCGLPTIHVQAFNGTEGTAKSAAASCAVFRFQAWARTANCNTSRAYCTDANIMMIQTVDNGSGYTRFIFDQEGSFHADVGSQTYDDFCDVELLRGVLAETVPCYKENFKERFGRDIAYNKCWYEEHKIIGKDSIHWEDRPHKGWEQRAMVNFTGLAMLHHSTIIQLADKTDARLTALENRLALGDGK